MDEQKRTNSRCRRQPLSYTPDPEVSPPKAVSLRYELATLEEAVLAARMLADTARHRMAGDAHDQARAPDACSAVLALVGARLQLLDLVIGGEVSPRLVLAHHNETPLDTEEDILLPVNGEVEP